ncbi:hypothetical protein [Leptothoe sp. PORK10 BA2]|uniref:hypothetical protein n=1 Tax=Leptothoe sp. PORK10 BA2 TaxID=3110254 RepID=UPI002B20F2DC|nr:hypothetical protein [Leptothoe sp. PORK10 BA2]MEA5464658.1 hypothetical protein [Leptothoe sp. PORK10 BA2]
MQITVLVNNAQDIQPTQTTAMLIGAAVAQGHRVGIVDVGGLACRADGQPWGQVRRLTHQTGNLADLMRAIVETPPVAMPLLDTDLLLMRTNPARDCDRTPAHHFALAIARRCQDSGVAVVNQPNGLMRAATKLYLLELPEFTRPKTLVSQNRLEILEFIHNLRGPAVLKPLQGTRGSDVFVVSSAEDNNLNQIIDVILRQGLVMVQRCIPGAAAGDTRVVVFNGKILQLHGHAAAIRRVPAPGDFRSNLHAGGHAQPAMITDAMNNVVTAIGPKLVQDGLALVGLDFIGDQLIEINVFSTGGLRHAEQFTGQSFSDYIIQSFADRFLLVPV